MWIFTGDIHNPVLTMFQRLKHKQKNNNKQIKQSEDADISKPPAAATE